MLTRNRITALIAACIIGLGLYGMSAPAEAGSYVNYGYSSYGGYGSSHIGVGYSSGYRHYRGYRPYYGHSYHRPYYKRHRYHRHGRHHYRRNNDHWIPFAIVGGLLGAVALSEALDDDDRYDRRYDRGYDRYDRSYNAPRYNSPTASIPCHEVHKMERRNGREVKLAGTMCYDRAGRAYIVAGSERVIEVYN